MELKKFVLDVDIVDVRQRERRLILEVRMGNEVFTVDAGRELARILREVAGRLATGTSAGMCRDVNGNAVGRFGVQETGELDE